MTMEKILQIKRVLTRVVMIEPSSLKQSFKRKFGMESRGHCSLSEAELSWGISVRVAGIQLYRFRYRSDGKRANNK